MSVQKKHKKQVIQDKKQGGRKQQEKKKPVFLILAAIVISTLFVYYPSFKNEFTNWDDPTYVTENKLIRTLSADNLKTIFDPKTVVSLNYHPITIFSLALNYDYSELAPKSYFVVNVLLHLLNTLLVFFFIFRLSNKNIYVASFVSALFGLHPMHVESVAWISERKDVLYAFFFLSASIFYLKYLEGEKAKFLVFAFLLFLLSCLSKAMAVSFVPVIFLIDYLRKRPFSYKVVYEKIPFFLLALAIGYNAVIVQSTEAINEFETFTLPQRFMFASYGFIMYLAKLFVPLHLSAFYPYPNLDNLGNIPTLFYAAPFVALTIVALPAFLLWKYKKEFLPAFIFGMAFYFFSIALVLQFISVGSAIMADRYSYIPYIGILFFIAVISERLLIGKKNVFLLVTIGCSLVFAYLSFQRAKVWKNTETLWTDVIEKYPLRVEVAYKNRGNYYAQQFNPAKPETQKKLDQAYNDHVTLVNMNSKDAGVYVNYANICGLRKEFDKSLEAYTKALELKKTNNYDIYLNRAITYSMMQQYDLAIKDFEMAASLKADDDKLFQNRAFVYLQAKQYEKALADYDILIQRFPNQKDYYFNRGLSKFNMGRHQDAIIDFNEAIKLQPDYKEAYYNLAVTYNLLNRPKEALSHALKAKSLGYPVSDSYLNELKAKGG